MAIEIERKFLVVGDGWRAGVARRLPMVQGYLSGSAKPDEKRLPASVRVRISGDQAWLNVKEAISGRARLEFEYDIGLDDAELMLGRLADGPVIRKTRHIVPVDDGLNWEIDEFADDNAGLIVAEIELPAEDSRFDRPAWLGVEVTDQSRFYNVALAARPYCDWSDDERLPVVVAR